jgi:hypothetical protein
MQNVNEVLDKVSFAECITSETLPMPYKKLNIILTCVVPLMVPILRSTKHIRNFMRSSVCKCTSFSNTLYG